MKQCSKCKIEKPLSEFWPDRSKRNGYSARCKDCGREYAREYRASRPDYEKTRYQKNKASERERHLKRKYGVDLTSYEKMLTDQNGLCAICDAPESEQFNSVFHVDHCHDTGEVRGLLCRGCNHMLGVVQDKPEILMRAVDYLSRRSQRK